MSHIEPDPTGRFILY